MVEIIITDSLKNRFWAKVNVSTDGCWNWTGSMLKGGYGRIGSDGRGGPNYIASRVSYTIHFGTIPDAMHVLHRCIGNRACVRPDHLYAGTPHRNAIDAVEQGRHVTQVSPRTLWQGTNNGAAKLSEADVRKIRERKESGAKQCDLATEFRVSEATISLVVNRVRWKHL